MEHVKDITPAQTPAASRPVHVAVTLPASRQAATIEDGTTPRTKVKLMPLQHLAVAPPQVTRPPLPPPKLPSQPAAASVDLSRPATIPLETLREALAASLAEALFLEREDITLDKPFIDLGLDSVVAVEWVRALNAHYSLNLTVARVYDYPTILALATFLETALLQGESTTLGDATTPSVVRAGRVEARASAAVSRPAYETMAEPVGALPVEPLLSSASGEAVRQPSVAGAGLCEALAASLAEALFLEPEEVALDKPFIDLGLDSVVAVEWVRALNAHYSLNLTVARVYDYPTILALATFLEGELAPQTTTPVAQSVSLDDVLQRVQQGHLDIAQAYQLLQQIDTQAGVVRG
jgi:acyl carrier protein